MIAFCIIIGDTIPRVFLSFFPFLTDLPILWLLTSRRFIIVLFTMGISFPLSLYKDISKVCPHLVFIIWSNILILITIVGKS